MAWTAPTTTLTGQLVSLELLQPHHAPDLVRAAADAEMSRFLLLDFSAPGVVDRMVADALAARDAGMAFPFAIVARRTGELLGTTRLFELDEANRKLEIGHTWLAPAAWRSGVNAECKLLLLTQAFEAMTCCRVQLKTDVNNFRSRRAIERLGCTFEGVLRYERVRRDGSHRDTAMYSLIEPEWPAARQTLQRRVDAAVGSGGLVADGGVARVPVVAASV